MENKKRNKFWVEDFAAFNKDRKKFTCLIETCKRELSAANTANVKRHYKLVHNIVIDGGDTLPKSIEKRKKAITKLNTTLNRENFLKCCIGLVSKKNLPFRIFDDEEFFKKIIEPYESNFDVTLNSKNISNILCDTSQQIKRSIATIVKNKMICLKIDIASRQDEHVLGVNIQYIHDFKICINTIGMYHLIGFYIVSPALTINKFRTLVGMIQLNRMHSAQYLKEEVMKCLEEYNIDIKQIYSHTTDNGANVLKVSKLLEELQDDNPTMTEDSEYDNTKTYDAIEAQLASVSSVVRCSAHTLLLAAYDVIRTLEAEIKDVRDAIRKIQTILRTGNQNISLPCLDNTTRWNSTYDMIIAMLGLKEYINKLDASTNISVNWIFVENFATAFKPLAECTKHMQKEQYIIGDFFRDWLECELEIQDIVQTNPYARGLYEAMTKRKSKLLENDAFIAALYLDPRFNFQGSPFLTNEQKKAAVDHLVKTYEMLNHISLSSFPQDEDSNKSFSECPLDITPSTSNTAHSKLSQHINRLVNTANLNPTDQNYQITTELHAMCEKPMEPLEINVLEYWKKISQYNLRISKLAEVVLAVPATQVSVERAFNALATVLTKFRSKLLNKSMSNILITKLNFELLDFSALNIEKTE